MLFIPLSHDNVLRHVDYQWATAALIAVNVVVFALQSIGGILPTNLALVPADFLRTPWMGSSPYAVYEHYSIFTYAFLHADFMHLASNMIFLWVFGDNIEDATGHVRYVVFYCLCGVAAGLTHALMLPNSKLPLIGASGAIAGIIAAYLVLHPHTRVWVLAFRVIPLRIAAYWILGAWIASQVGMAVVMQSDGMAWSAHVGGILAGALLIVLFRRPGVPLFDRPQVVQNLML